MRKRMTLGVVAACTLAIGTALPCWARGKKDKSARSLEQYLAQFHQNSVTQQEPALGSLWNLQSPLADGVSDYKARSIGDPITVQVTESTLTTSSGAVNTQRQFSASTGIDGLPAKINTGGVSTLFSGKGENSLKGTGATSYNAVIRTTLGGQIVAVLPNGNLVVEAQRSVLMNNDNQTVVVRGMIRPSDIGPNNAVLSTQLSNLQIEIKGKGVVADNTRPPNPLVRTLLRLVGF